MELEFCQQILEKYPHIKFHESPSSGIRVVPCGQTVMTKLTVAARNFANTSKDSSFYVRFAATLTVHTDTLHQLTTVIFLNCNNRLSSQLREIVFTVG